MLYETHEGKAKLFLSNRVSKRLDFVFERTFIAQTSQKYLPKQTLVFPGFIPPIKILEQNNNETVRIWFMSRLGFYTKNTEIIFLYLQGFQQEYFSHRKGDREVASY